MKHSLRYLRQSQGYTLIELMMSTFLMVLVLVVIFLFWQTVTHQYSVSFEQSLDIEEVYRALNKMTKEIRRASISDNGSYALEVVEDNQLVFYADIDADSQKERVHYFRSNGSLMRGITEPVGQPAVYDTATETVSTITDYLIDSGIPLFWYYNSDWPGDSLNNPLSPAARQLDTRMIEIIVNVDTGPYAGGMATASAVVQLRNLKDNY